MIAGIAGVGGIGSNVAVNLVRYGIKKLMLVDFDRVERSNLNRQFYFEDQVGQYKVDACEENLRRIDRTIKIQTGRMRLDRKNMAEVFRDCHVVVEGFDCSKSKKDLLETFCSTDRLLVFASGVAGQNLELITTRKIGNAFIVGDFESDVEHEKLYAPKIQIIASMMSMIVIKRFKQ